MHIRENHRNQLLKTKIVATLGPRRGGLLNQEGQPDGKLDEVFDPQCAPITEPIPTADLLRWFIHAGVDVIRLNMSFASIQEPYGAVEKEVLDWVTKHRDGLARHLTVLGDLPGPKVRIRLQKERFWERGETFRLDFREEGRVASDDADATVLVSEQPFDRTVKVDNQSISEYVRKCGKTSKEVIFYIGDGQVTLRAEGAEDGIVTCKVSKAGVIKNNKGLTIRHAKLAMPPFPAPDKKALEFLLDNGAEVVSFIAVSFVRDKDDILRVKQRMEARLETLRPHSNEDEMSELRRAAPAIIAKIETADARDNIESILDVADGVMIARGDLGLQFDPQEVPPIQRELIKLCNVRGKPVITATQMLESMTENPEPTRAEATDVFNAILSGTDAVMLSGETSTGRYPVQAIEMMVKIAEKAEDYYFEHASPRRFEDILEEFGKQIDQTTARLGYEAKEATKKARDPQLKKDWSRHAWQRDLYGEKEGRSEKQETTDRISQAACNLSLRKKDVYKAIIAPTTSGRTARMISRFRPNLPIIGAAHDIYNARKLALSFGVYPFDIGKEEETDDIDKIFERACEEAKKPGYLSWNRDFHLLNPGDVVISTSGTPLHQPGTTNLIQIRELEMPKKDE